MSILRNPKAKGNRIRRKCMIRLEEGDYIVDVVEKTGKFNKIKDMFGLWDLTCRHKEGNRTIITDIQVTCNKPHSHRVYVDWAEEWADDCYRLEQWVWIDNVGWNVYTYRNNRIIYKWDGQTKEIKKITRYEVKK